MLHLNLDTLRNAEYIWVGGIGDVAKYNYKVWEGFQLPEKHFVLNVEFEEDYIPGICHDFKLLIDTDKTSFEFNVLGDDVLLKYTDYLSFDEDSLKIRMIDEIKRILSTTWSGTNGVSKSSVLKSHILNNKYFTKYFYTDYPEILV